MEVTTPWARIKPAILMVGWLNREEWRKLVLALKYI
jgi:hypothetical protein